MPYIKEMHRSKFEEELCSIENKLCLLPREDIVGELNYVISTLISKLLKRYPRRYYILSMFKGVLQDVVDEYKEQVMKPYEEEKKKENGAIY